jgi:hypothetical protein
MRVGSPAASMHYLHPCAPLYRAARRHIREAQKTGIE